MTKVAVILSGCGVQDGAEIHESVLTLLALDELGCEAVCAAPNVAQMHVVDHLTGQPTAGTRNVLVESARIARGAIRDLATLEASEVDAVVLPGGFGAAKNLCDFAAGGADYALEPQTARFLREMHAAKKPIGALCIAPALLAKAIPGARLTIGDDAPTAARLGAAGATHVAARVDQIVVDEANRLVTTPCYMLASRISQVRDGARELCEAVLAMAR
jgi:enhancing lycopene biosynthesis protein 2